MIENVSSLSNVKMAVPTRQSSNHSCRICLQHMEVEQQCFCNCKGEMRFVHQLCLFEWIKCNQIDEEFGETFSTCDVCQGRIRLRTERKCRIRGCRNWCYNLVFSETDQFQWKNLAFIFIYLVLVSVFTLMVVKYMNIKDQNYLTTAIVIGIVVLVCIIGFCAQSAMVLKLQVVGIESRDLVNRFAKDQASQK